MAWKRPWIKLWVEMLDDPKMVSLNESQRWIWCALLLAASRSPEPGRMLLPSGRPMTILQITQATRTAGMSVSEFEETLGILEEQHMVAWRSGALEILHWKKRQESSDGTASERMRRYRESHRINGSRGVTDVTASVTTTVTPSVTNVTAPVTPGVTVTVTPPVMEKTNGGGPAPSLSRDNSGVNMSSDRNNRNGDRNKDRNEPRNDSVTLRPQEVKKFKENTEEEIQPSGAKAPSGLPPGSESESSHAPQERTFEARSETAPAISGKYRQKTGGNPAVDQVLSSIQQLWGQPIVHWGREAKEVKAALARGYKSEEIIQCWQASQQCSRWQGRWMPMSYLVEDLGEFLKNGGRPLKKWGEKGKEAEDAERDKAFPSAAEWRSRGGRW